MKGVVMKTEERDYVVEEMEGQVISYVNWYLELSLSPAEDYFKLLNRIWSYICRDLMA